MRTIDSTKYSSYITDLDPRVTYRRDRSVVELGQTLTATPITPGTSLAIVFVGAIGVGPLAQQLQYNWTVEQLTSTTVRVTSIQLQQSQDVIFDFDSGVSSLIPLVGQPNLSFRFVQGGSSYDGSIWNIEGFTKADEDFPSILTSLNQLGDAAIISLFPNEDPFILFKSLWQQSNFFQDKLTGITLAYVYGAEGVRING